VLDALIGVAAALLVSWLLLIVALLLLRPKGAMLADAVRMLPDLLRLVRRLAADRSLPRTVRLRVWLLMAYLAMPIDIVPDVIPIVGYADDVIIVALVLRSLVRRAGIDAVRRHWPGSADGFAALCRITGLASRGPAITHG
jgi:uncharacterized membrane protein YkvA (DUF1232 family)